MSYNGWTSYETWAVNLWVDNEEGSQDWRDEIVEEAIESARCDDEIIDVGGVVDCVSEQLQALIVDGNPLLGSNSLYLDLLTAALGEVNWREIADHWVEDALEEAKV